MKVSDVMSPQTVTIKLDTTIQEAADKMKSMDIGALPVTDEEKIKGMLTDRDIVLRCIAEGKDPKSTPAHAVMTEHIRYVFDDQDVNDAAMKMKDTQIRRLVVLNRDKRLVGFVSMGDISSKTDDAEMIADMAKGCSEPTDKHTSQNRSVA